MYGETEQTVLYKMPKKSSIPKVSTIITKTQNAYGKIYMILLINQQNSKLTSSNRQQIQWIFHVTP